MATVYLWKTQITDVIMLLANFADSVIVDWGLGTLFRPIYETGVRFFHIFFNAFFDVMTILNVALLSPSRFALYFVSSIQRKFSSIARIFWFSHCGRQFNKSSDEWKNEKKNSGVFISVANDYFLVLFLKCMQFTNTLGPNSNEFKMR